MFWFLLINMVDWMMRNINYRKYGVCICQKFVFILKDIDYVDVLILVFSKYSDM